MLDYAHLELDELERKGGDKYVDEDYEKFEEEFEAENQGKKEITLSPNDFEEDEWEDIEFEDD